MTTIPEFPEYVIVEDGYSTDGNIRYFAQSMIDGHEARVRVSCSQELMNDAGETVKSFIKDDIMRRFKDMKEKGYPNV